MVFERKGLGDLFGSLTQGYKRFKAEIQRAREAHVDLILLVEHSLSTVLDGYAHSQFGGDSMVKKLMTLQVRHKFPVVFCQARFEAARYVVEYFCAIGREHVALARSVRKERAG